MRPDKRVTGELSARLAKRPTSWPCALVVATVLGAPVTPPRLREPDVQQDVLTNADELAGWKVASRFGEARHL